MERTFETFFTSRQLETYQRAVLRYTYRGLKCLKSPIDLALYLLLLTETKPATIIEIGSAYGGSAMMFRDFSRMAAQPAEVISIDLNTLPPEIEGVRFLRGDTLRLDEVFAEASIFEAPRPWLVVEDSAHTFEACSAALRFFARHLQAGEMLVMEDGVLSDLGLDERYDGGPNRAIAAFFELHPGIFSIETRYCDMFGPNATYSPNGFLRRTDRPFSA